MILGGIWRASRARKRKPREMEGKAAIKSRKMRAVRGFLVAEMSAAVSISRMLRRKL